MKKNTIILLLVLSTTLTFAQKKDKIKGSKTVTIEQREVGNFESLEVEDNLEVHLERGEKSEIKIEADDNLHTIISSDLRDNILRIYTTKEAQNYKKLIVRVTYTKDLNLATAKNESTISAIQEILLDNLTFKAHDFSQLYLNVNAKNFILQVDDKSKTELNLKSENAIVELSKNASLKALVSTIDLKVDLYQKSNATIEGDATNAILRLDNNSSLTGNKLTIKNADITTESYSTCSLNAVTTVIIDAAEKSEIQILGTPKIEIRKFADEAKLIKKLK
ncbi:GIN domain-containing protein [Flavobacterium sp. LB3P122]|uniref:GIN domain-containing protein n=1 Tax=Flavobacterium algoriphilum TaxID=3398738 RepID=UPI003A8797E2